MGRRERGGEREESLFVCVSPAGEAIAFICRRRLTLRAVCTYARSSIKDDRRPHPGWKIRRCDVDRLSYTTLFCRIADSNQIQLTFFCSPNSDSICLWISRHFLVPPSPSSLLLCRNWLRDAISQLAVFDG